FDGGRLGNDLGENPIEIALWILFVEAGHGLFRGRGPRGRHVTEQGRALEQVAQGLADGREILVEVGRNLGEVLALRGLSGKAQADPNSIDRLKGLIDGRLVDL